MSIFSLSPTWNSIAIFSSSLSINVSIYFLPFALILTKYTLTFAIYYIYYAYSITLNTRFRKMRFLFYSSFSFVETRHLSHFNIGIYFPWHFGHPVPYLVLVTTGHLHSYPQTWHFHQAFFIVPQWISSGFFRFRS